MSHGFQKIFPARMSMTQNKSISLGGQCLTVFLQLLTKLTLYLCR